MVIMKSLPLKKPRFFSRFTTVGVLPRYTTCPDSSAMVTSARSGELDRLSGSAPPCPRCSRSPKTSRPPRSAALAFCACDPPGFLFIAFVVLVPASSRGRWQYTKRGRVLATNHHQEKAVTDPIVRTEQFLFF